MAEIIQGRIVYALDAIPDPQGRNPKENRPFVVISTLNEIAADGPIDGVGISRNVHGNEEEVELEWGPNARTGLADRSAAICSWRRSLDRDRLNVGSGYVKPKYLAQILRKVG